ncbi:MAG: hypothetical protein GXZ11_01470 [Tissierellia bacterium]|nr:hypothetical protein [Tissierellia bacterium]
MGKAINTIARDDISLDDYSTGTMALDFEFRTTGEIFTLEYEKARDYGLIFKYDYPYEDEEFPGEFTVSDVNLLKEVIYKHPECVPDWTINYTEEDEEEPIIKNIKLADFLKEYFFGKENLFEQMLPLYADLESYQPSILATT